MSTANEFTSQDPITVNVIQPLYKFSKDSVALVRKCTKPDRKGAFHFLSFNEVEGP